MKATTRQEAPVEIEGGGVEIRVQGRALEDSEYVDFSPSDEFRHVIDHIKAQG